MEAGPSPERDNRRIGFPKKISGSAELGHHILDPWCLTSPIQRTIEVLRQAMDFRRGQKAWILCRHRLSCIRWRMRLEPAFEGRQ
uniref:Uncharacterized protein n=1 Tax=Bradyrhizobium ottawaense TaxID=931866 RepID=A0A2U8P5R9_9BRAD|nr:hypothetical protein CIT37_13265 [Bradyrhizobium ottawaense]